MNPIDGILPFRLREAVRAAAPEGGVYLVGGAVRDALLGRQPHDLDFAVTGNARQIARRTADTLKCAFYPLDTGRGQYRLILVQPPGRKITIDFARLRGESITADLAARDFTIGAMALDVLAPGKVIDPLGGAKDLQDRRLRQASSTALADDPIRILRGLRLAADFRLRIDPETVARMRAEMPGLGRISAERLRDELFRILESGSTSEALRALEILGGLPVLFPDLTSLKDTPQTYPHYQDVWNHTLSVLDHFQELLFLLASGEDGADKANIILASASLRLGRYRQKLASHFSQEVSYGRSLAALIKLAVLYHDSAKPGTASLDADGRIHNYGHEDQGAERVRNRARELQLSRLECSRLETIVANHMRIHSLAAAGKPPSRRAVFRFFRDCGEAGVDICLHTLADTLGTYGPALPQEIWSRYLDTCRILLDAWWDQRAEQVEPILFMDGNDIQAAFNLPPGAQIGRLLEALREAQAVGRVSSREQAVDYLSQHLGGKNK